MFYELYSLGGLTRYSKAAVQCSHCNVCIGLDEEDLHILLSLAHGEIVKGLSDESGCHFLSLDAALNLLPP